MMESKETFVFIIISVSLLVNALVWYCLYLEAKEIDQLSQDLKRIKGKMDQLKQHYRENYEMIESIIGSYYEEQIDTMSATKFLAEIIAPPELPFECGSTENPCSKEYFSNYASKLRTYVSEHGTVYELIGDLQAKVKELSDSISKLEIKP